ncbi:hypothetical protein CHUAL_003406 [Chamberlinius hualienensis]
MGSHHHQQFCLRWNSHQLNMLNVFDQLLQTESFVDVTLACDGLSLKAHKVVLSACSPYFQKLLLDNPCQHPIIILKDVTYADLKLLIDFMYKGEVSVAQERLQDLVKTAEVLKIKGLSEVCPSYNCESTNFGANVQHNTSDRVNGNENMESSTEDMTATIIAVPCVNERPRSRGSPPSKKRRAQRHSRKSGSASDCDSDAVSSIQASTESVISKGSATTDDNSENGNSTLNNGLQISNGGSGNHCLLSTKGSGENNSSNLETPALLGIDGFPAVSLSNDQFQTSLQTSLTDAIVDQRKNAIGGLLKLVDCSNSQTSISKTLCTASVATMTTSTQAGNCFSNETNERRTDGNNPTGLQWASNNMNHALEVVRQGHMSLSKTSAIYSIPTSNWTEDDLHQALEAVRTGRLSITKAAVTFGIPNSTLWQRSRREGIDTSRSGGNFHAAQWSEATLAQAIQAVRMGHMSISKASTTYGIPSTTLWSKAKRYGIETSRKLMSEQDREEFMWQALQAVKNGFMSMTQASIKYNVPYTTLWKNFKKWEINGLGHHLAVSLHSLPQQLENMIPENSCASAMNT